MSPEMTVDDQLLYESRVRMRNAGLAAAAAVLLVVASVVQLSGVHTKVDELTLDLITVHKRFPLDVVGAVINALGLLALGLTLSFLYRFATARNQHVQGWVKYLVNALTIVGAVAAGLSGIVYSVVIADKSSSFVSHGTQTYVQANQLTDGAGLKALPPIGQAAALVLAVAFVMVALQAMRVGLLTRLMGYLGVFTGFLIVFPIGGPSLSPVIEAFWLLALAYLLTGRWPNGVPPSWRSGKAEPWPSNQQMREQRIREAGQADRPRGGRSKPPEAPAETVGASPAPRTRSATPKRKRKRRR